MDYQRITAVLLGNATQDAAMKTAKESGKPYADFRLAVRNRQGEPTYFPSAVLASWPKARPPSRRGRKC